MEAPSIVIEAGGTSATTGKTCGVIVSCSFLASWLLC